MADEDFDVDSLAAYLHILPAQVAKLANRGKIPARRVAGQWRFSSAEIHHWLEDRIGLSDEDGLVEVETVLRRHREPAAPRLVSIAELLPSSAIAIPLQARTRASVIRAMSELAASTGLLWDAKKMATAVRAREAMHPTALEEGVALMHPRRPMRDMIGQSFIALGLTPNGIPFAETRAPLTDVFFLICAESDQVHLRILARLSRLISSETFLADLRQAGSATAARDFIAEREASLD